MALGIHLKSINVGGWILFQPIPVKYKSLG